MNPEREAEWREAAGRDNPDPWAASTYLEEALEVLDQERARVERLELVAEAARTIRTYDGLNPACYGLLRGEYGRLLDSLDALEQTDEWSVGGSGGICGWHQDVSDE